MGHESRGRPVFLSKAAEPESDVNSGVGTVGDAAGGQGAALDQPGF